MREPLIIPPRLRRGDRIAIVSPASIIDPKLVEGAAATLREWGFEPVVGAHALGASGSYSGSVAERLADMAEALTDPKVRGILCSRGGYGAVHLLQSLAGRDLRHDPKWVIGFSDISALHALMQSQGVASIHGSMARQLAAGANDELNTEMHHILSQHRTTDIAWKSGEGFHPGRAMAPMVGGNLTVIAALIGTPYDMIQAGTILVIEDVSEPIYKVERIMYQLLLSGRLERLSALVVGQFTEYHPDRNHATMEEMLAPIISRIGIPVATGAPIGHVDGNRPWVEGALTTLTVDPDGEATITQTLNA